MRRSIDLNDLRLLMQVVEHGSFTAAARVTGISKSAISQRISALEATVGTGLIRRTSRSFSLTDAGGQLLPHARALEAIACRVDDWLTEQGGELRGMLRVSCSNAIAQFALSPIVPRFLARHGRVVIRVETSNRLVDLVGEGFDMTLRGHVGPLKNSLLRQRSLVRTPWALAASPDWVAEHGEVTAPANVPRGEALYFSIDNSCMGWTLSRAGEEVHLDLAPRLISDDMISLRTSAIAGGGITCLPAYLMRDAFEREHLVRILPDWASQTSTISALTPPEAQSSKLTAAFSDFLAVELPRVVLG